MTWTTLEFGLYYYVYAIVLYSVSKENRPYIHNKGTKILSINYLNIR